MGCMRLAKNTGRKNRQKSPKIRHLRTIAQLSRAVFSQLRHVSTIGKNLLNSNIIVLHTFSQYGELQPISDWDRFTSFGHHSKFQRLSRVGFVTAATSLTGCQPNFARCLAVSWAGILYIHFRSCPLTEFCQVQNSLCVQVLRSPILAALLHGTRVVGVSQTLRPWGEGATYIRQGGHHVGHRPTF